MQVKQFRSTAVRELGRVLGVSFALLLTDTAVSMVLATFYGVLQLFSEDSQSVLSYPEAAMLLGLARLIFYFVIFVVFFYVLNKVLPLEKKLPKLILLNCGLYLLISFLFGFILEPQIQYLFMDEFFFILITSTILSPVILYRVPYFYRAYQSLQ